MTVISVLKLTLIISLICLFVVVHIATKRGIYSTQRRRFQYMCNKLGNCTTAAQLHLPWSSCGYVGFGHRMAGRNLHGIGNRLFYYSAIVYVSWLTGRRPCVWTTSTNIILNRVFDVNIQRVDKNKSNCPMYTFRQRGIAVYDSRVESLVNISGNISLLLEGYFQSWMYTNPVAMQLRQQLRFKKEYKKFASDFLSRIVPPGWSKVQFIRVGVHVRRGDFLRQAARSLGLTVANDQYIQTAMRHFVDRFPRIQFIVASDDIQWCRKHLTLPKFNKTIANIVFSIGHNAGQDLTLLASCNHTIITTGTFGWWAAWFVNGITIYYANYPKRGSKMSRMFNGSEYYLPDWIGIGDVR